MLSSSIRRGSGGRGKWNGGDGMEKLFQARMPVNFSIVSQRRVFAPRGMDGGQDGARGRNTWFKRILRDGEANAGADRTAPEWEEIMVPSNGIAALGAGDRVRISTPGGGGWGRSE
jgi:5-oxoprolinase (ATP-hydrolysing)